MCSFKNLKYNEVFDFVYWAQTENKTTNHIFKN